MPQVGERNGRPFYAKDGDAKVYLWWSGGRWWLGKADELGRNRGWLRVESAAITPPSEGWQVYSKAAATKWVAMADLVVDFAERLLLEGPTPGQPPHPTPNPDRGPGMTLTPTPTPTSTPTRAQAACMPTSSACSYLSRA